MKHKRKTKRNETKRNETKRNGTKHKTRNNINCRKLSTLPLIPLLPQLAVTANARRLIAVRLNRGHDFSHGVDGVKAEISPSISEFAPDASAADTGGPGIPIMAVSV